MESSFVADSPDYWNLDLRRLTWCGWLLMLLAVVTLFGAALALAGLYRALGWDGDHSRGWVKLVIFLPALGASCAVFALGRWGLGRAGLSVLRQDKRRREKARER